MPKLDNHGYRNSKQKRFWKDIQRLVRIKKLQKLIINITAMENQEKADIINLHFLSDKAIAEMQKINCYSEWIKVLLDEDFRAIVDKKVYFNCFFSPGSRTINKIEIPVKSQLINLDINFLKAEKQDQRVAIILHEIGHAVLTPSGDVETDEFNADDFAIKRGYGLALKKSLEENIIKNPNEYAKPITHTRIARINQPA